MKKIDIVIPCYNEEESLPLYFDAVDPIIEEIKDYSFKFILVDDGSKDKTYEIMRSLHEQRGDVTIIKESRNNGQNAALTVGLLNSTADYVIMMDVDLQDPVTLLKDICKAFDEGYEVVNPHRSNRKEDSFFKRKTAGMFYKLINRLEGKEVIPENVNCFRGLSRRAVDEINSLPEKDRFYVSLVPLVGYKTTSIDFIRAKRDAGRSKYNISNLFTHAFNLISTTTSKPLYIPIKTGVIGSIISLLLTIITLIGWIISLHLAKSLLAIELFRTFFIVSIILLAMFIIIAFIGLMCIYLHNMLINTRNRPTAIIEEIREAKDDKESKDEHLA